MSQTTVPYTAALRRLMELLATDASAEQLTAVAARARADGIDDHELNEIDRAVSTALGVRQVLHRQRRREAELTALFDTAGDLAALRDLDAVLHSIVRRARTLLATDTAYLTLVDEAAQDTFMRVTDGSVSLAFQQLRLKLGEGLGGLVAQTMRPYASPDYRRDERFQHTQTIDHGVLDEGLVAILGVPLLLGSGPAGDHHVIGVLFAADRGPRGFSPDEVALLSSLAAHAAIAIDTARALADAKNAAAELTEANAVIQEHAASTQRAAEAHDRLTDLVLRGSEVSEVAAAVAEFLGGRLTIFDPRGDVLAQAGGEAGDGPPDPDALLRAVTRARAEGRSVRDVRSRFPRRPRRRHRTPDVAAWWAPASPSCGTSSCTGSLARLPVARCGTDRRCRAADLAAGGFPPLLDRNVPPSAVPGGGPTTPGPSRLVHGGLECTMDTGASRMSTRTVSP